LIKEKIQVVLYFCTGTEVEWKIQQGILKGARECLQYMIKSPQPGMPDTTVTIPIINGQPTSLFWDSKHASKTLQNNLFSGTHLLILGNYTLLYATIHNLAFMKHMVHKRCF